MHFLKIAKGNYFTFVHGGRVRPVGFRIKRGGSDCQRNNRLVSNISTLLLPLYNAGEVKGRQGLRGVQKGVFASGILCGSRLEEPLRFPKRGFSTGTDVNLFFYPNTPSHSSSEREPEGSV
jgi:hypothetical protein